MSEGGGEARRWDAYAESYEAHASTGLFNALYDRPAVLELLGPVHGQDVLDAGCGPGLYAEQLVARGARVVGLDGAPEMVDRARRRVGSRAAFLVHDLNRPLPFDDGRFDAAVMALVIHHLDDRPAALRELRRVLRTDGRLIVSTHHPTADWTRLGGSYFASEWIEEVWRRGWRVRYRRQPLEETCREFYDAGFTIERLVEPRPAAEARAADPDDFDELMSRPGFIAFRLTKRGGAAP